MSKPDSGQLNFRRSFTKMPKLEALNLGDAQLPYLDFAGKSPEIIFLHATGFLPWLWQPVIEKIIPRFRSLAPFICNYRPSDPEKDGLNWEIIAVDIAAFCGKLKITEPLLVGHSMGATVLTIANALYGLKARGIVLIEPIFLPEAFYSMPMELKDHPLASRSIKRTNRWPNEQEARAYLQSKSLFSGWDEKILQLYLEFGMEKQKDGSLNLTCPPQTEAALFMGGRFCNPWPLLSRVSCPVLVLEGAASDNKKFVDIQKAVSLFSRGMYKSIAAAGHLIPMQKPAEIALCIQDFMATTI